MSHILRGKPPWCHNRLGQGFQTLCFSDYRYLRDGNPEIRESLLMERLLRPGMMVVDIGANYGCFSMEASHFVGPTGWVHAFEPTPKTRAQLKRHLGINNITKVTVFSSAVGDTMGTASFRIHHEATGLNTLARENILWQGKTLVADEILDVPVVTLDAHAASQGLREIDVLKIDVEGFELAVVRGARELLAARRVSWIILEIADSTSTNAGLSPVDLLTELDELGYHLSTITIDGEVGERVKGVRSFPGANYLAYPKL